MWQVQRERLEEKLLVLPQMVDRNGSRCPKVFVQVHHNLKSRRVVFSMLRLLPVSEACLPAHLANPRVYGRDHKNRVKLNFLIHIQRLLTRIKMSGTIKPDADAFSQA